MILHVIEAIRRAPSRYNEQPVRIRTERDALTLFLAQPGDEMALGTALESALVALSAFGQRGEYEIRPDREVRLTWRSGAKEDALFRCVPLRRTSRLPYAPELGDVPRVEGIRLVSDPEALRRALQPDFAWRRWLRVSPRDPRWFRDGLPAYVMGLRGWEARLLTWPPWSWLADDPVPVCPAMGEVESQGDAIEDGRRLMRFWLMAAGLGLSLHPLWHQGRLVFRLGVSAPVPASPRRPLEEMFMGLPHQK